MTKLEEKLIQFGYVRYDLAGFGHYYSKKLGNEIEMVIYYDDEEDFITHYCIKKEYSFYNQQDIDNLQQAFNILQKNLKELKEYEQID